jgi:hypothetical protein
MNRDDAASLCMLIIVLALLRGEPHPAPFCRGSK